MHRRGVARRSHGSFSKKNPRRSYPYVLVLGLSLSSGSALGAFFQLAENSASGLGNAFAGGAAIAEDASTVWYNPAGLARLKGSDFVAAGHLIFPSTKYTDRGPTGTGSTNVLGLPLGGGNGGDAGEDAFVPNLYYTRPINERVMFGLGVNAPFGLETDYDDGWVGRYYTDKSEIKTININPGVGWKVTDTFSFGGGISVQYADATLTQNIDTGTLDFVLLGNAFGLTPTASDSSTKLEADDTEFGYNLGFLWNAGQKTRVGLAYRSEIDFDLKGDSTSATSPNAAGGAAVAAARAALAGAGLLPQDSDTIKVDVTFPATISLSVYHQMNPRWAIMGDVTQTQWSDLPELRIMFGSGALDSVITLGLKDVERYSFGATYLRDNRWAFRFGAAFDETPTPSAELRTPRLPDEDRTWLTFGFNYRKNERMSFDFAYAFIDIDDAEINKSTAVMEDTFRGNLVGDYDADVNIVSAQVNWRFQTR